MACRIYKSNHPVLGCLRVAFFVLATASPAWLEAQCPTIAAIMVDACGTEEANEFVVIHSGGGFNVSDLQLDFDANNNIIGPENNDINIGASPCGLTEGEDDVVENGCDNVIEAGPGDFIPPNSFVVLQTSFTADFEYDFSAACALQQCVFVIKSTCARSAGAFSNGGTGTRTTVLSTTTGCSNSYTYDRADLIGGNGAYFIPPGSYGNGGCAAPPVSFGNLPPNINDLPNVSICANSYVLPPITGTNLTGNQAYFTEPEGEGTSYPAGATVTTSGTYYIYDGASGCDDEESFLLNFQTPTTPVLTVSGPFCDPGAAVPLPTVQSGITGSWSGPGVTGNSFNPTGLAGNVTLTFTPDPLQCANPTTTNVTVNTGPTANPASITECGVGTQTFFDLTVANSTVNGGTGNTVNWFSNAAGTVPIPDPTFYFAGSGTVYAQVVGSGCNSSIVPVTLTVAMIGFPALGTATVCENSGLFDLTTLNDPAYPTGAWSGPGVTGNNFDPTGQSGSVSLTFTPSTACAFPSNTTVTVEAPVTPAVSGVPSPVCENGGAVVLPTTQGGVAGTWSGPGVSGGNSFDPAGLSGSVILTFTPDAGECANAATASVSITQPVVPFMTPIGPFCITDPGLALPISNSGVTGNWSGPGVTANYFTPLAAGLGSHTLTFTPDPGQCATSNTLSAIVEPMFTPTLGTASLCQTDPVFNLNLLEDPLYTNGIWDGPGVTGDNFDPAGQSGSVTLEFFTLGEPCAELATTTITVSPATVPVLSGVPAAICENAAPIVLPNVQGGFTGVWSGIGVSFNNFDPSGQSGNVTLTFTPDAGQCASPATTVINVTNGTTPTISGIPASVCETATPVALPTTQDGVTGTWSGNGVASNSFDPSGLSGNVTLTFTPDAGQCATTATATVSVTTPVTPAISGVPATICESAAAVALPTTQGGITGNWSGNGVASNSFDPSGLSGNVTLTFTPDAGQCATTATATVSVTTPVTPAISGVPATICESAAAVALPTTQGGITGNWSGNGVSGNSFDPSGLSGNVTLTFTPDAGQCAATATATVSVTTPVTPAISGVPATICESAAAVALPTTQGGFTGNWSGNGVASNSFDPSGLSGNVTLTFTPDAGQCATTATATVSVTTPVTPAISGVPATICESAAAVALPTTQGGFTGNWSGNGVASNSFDPSGLSGNVTLTFTPAAGQCAATATATVSVTTPVTPAISGVPATICESAAAVALPTTQGGFTGNWSGNGVASNSFDPSGLSGNVTLTFTPDAGQCATSATATVSVTTPVTPAISGVPATICESAAAVALPTTQGGITGNWSGNGVSGNSFDPSGLSGNVTLTFTPAAGQCATTATATVNVEDVVPPVVSGVPATACQTDPAVALPTTLSGITGNWSGIGVTGNNFNPLGLSGNITLTFAPTAGQCAATATAAITVNAPVTPAISGLPASICESAAPVALPTMQDGITGNWSGNGVSGNSFDPSGLSGNVTLTFTPTAGQCASTATATVAVGQLVTPSVAGVPASVCENEPPVPLPTTLSGITGSWSGTGVSANIFNPNGQSGNVTLTFTPDAGQCANGATTAILVNQLATPALGTVALCQTSGLYSLSNLADPAYPAGAWSGPGVTGSNFDPSGQSGSVTLTFTSSASCTQAATTTVTVNVPVTPTLGTAAVCESGSTVDLGSLTDPLYPAGAWSGPGVTGSSFDPSGQSGSVMLTFTPSASCTEPATTTVQVNTPPSFTNLVDNTCDAATQAYTVTFDIVGGNPGSYTVDGLPVSGTAFTSPSIPSGTAYTFNLDDGNGCGPTVISGSTDCACVTDAGTMDFTNAPYLVCDSTGFTVDHEGNQQLDGSDVLQFVLHTNAGATLGTVAATSSTTSFTYPNGIVPGQTYYVSAIAGNNDGLGNVVLADPCLSVSQGVPVTFYSPTVQLSAGGDVCEDECFPFNLLFTGEGPFDLTYEVVANGTPFPGTLSSAASAATLDICPATYGTSSGNLSLNLLELTDGNGCSADLPAPVTQSVTVVPQAILNLSPTLCPGGSVTVNGTVYNQTNPTGSETFPGGSYLGCDSVVNVSLAFYPAASFNLDETLCTGGSITVNGTVYNAANPTGTEVLAGASANGCDSTVFVSLSFSNAAIFNLNPTLCPGGSVTVNGTLYDQTNPAGSETFPGGSYLGCDSVVNVSLAFFPAAVFNLNEALCPGGGITVNGTLYNQANPNGTEVLAGASANGCDSTVFVSLIFSNASVFNLNEVLCPGGSVSVNGTLYNQTNPTGSETFPGGSYLGCDSVVNVSLAFYPAASFNLNETLCTGGSITVNGTVYNAANPTGTEVLAGASANGCDSTVFVSLAFGNAASFNLNPTLCPGGSVTVNGTVYNQANPTGSETFPGGSYLGCDSVVNVSLAFFPAAVFNLNEALCPGGGITVNGTLYNQANPNGTEVLAGASANGCDSTVFVSLSFSNAAIFNLNPTLCPGGSVTVNGTLYDQTNPAGSETFPGGSYLGCDSVVNVSLAFFPAASFNLNETLCTGGSITVNGTVYNAANPTGTETFPGGSYLGCDSVVNVSLAFYPAAVFNLNEALCPGGGITVNGTLYNAANPTGSETFPGGSYLGCDSVVNVSLAFYPAASFNLNETLCTGGSITVNGTLYNAANPTGTEVLAGASANGCDSTVFVSLAFGNAASFNLNPTLCPGGSVTVNGTVYNQANPTGSETFPGGSYLGCDSVVNVSLAFYPAATFNLNETLCTGGSITVNGTLYNAANPTGTEVLAGASANGCDSTVFVSLAFGNAAVFNLAPTLCPGGSVTVNGTLYNQTNPTGSETFPGGSYLGCDSVVNVSLAFYPAATFNLNETLCTGGSITVNGTVYNAANPTGTEVLAGASANGCDSTVFVSLAFGNAASFNLNPTLCPGGSVTVNGTVYNQANPTGSETFPGGSYLGCDSVVNVSLAFYPAASFNLNETLCTGGSITVNGTLYNAANPTGTEVLAGASANGCDSTVFVSLAFDNVAVFNLDETLCPGGSVSVNGTLYNQTNPTGSETFPGGSYLGCDSVVNVSLAFYPAATFNLNETLCTGGSITVNGTLYNAANPTGTEVLAGASANGCDSTVFVSLAFGNAASFNLNPTLCPGGSVTVNGTVYNQANPTGSETFPGGSYLGCDSVVNVSLAFYPAASFNLNETLCTGGSITVNGTLYNAANPTGTETFPGGSYLGCDSVVNVSLAFYPAASFNLNETLCTGGSITVNGTVYNAANPTGTEVLAGASANGCDSTVFVSLAFGNAASFNLNPTLCPGGSVTVNGTLYDQTNPAGSETFPGGSYLGCDSVVNVSLAFYPAASFNLNETLCTGGSITVNGTVYNAANPTGTEVLAGASANGCDSTVFVSLAFGNAASFNLNPTLCPGGSVTVNGTVYNQANPTGSETFPGGSYLGCDSVVNVSLAFYPAASFNLNETLCTGGSITVNGTLYNQANPNGTEVLAGASANGCDSTVFVSLAFDNVAVFNLDETLCPGGSVVVNGTTYNQANPTGSETFHGGSYLGCDSVVNVSLAFYPAASFNLNETLCTGGSITVNGTVYNAANPTGTEVLAGASANGCDSTVFVSLAFGNAAVFNLAPTLCPGGSVTVNGTVYNQANPTGTETFPGGSYLGCDSVVNVSLAFFPAASFNLNETLCTGGSITVNGTLYNAANPTGTEVLAGASANGCDSTVFVSLAFGNAAVFNLAPTLCPGGSVTVNGTVYNQANPTGSETFPGGSYLGCDSVVNVSLAFYPAASFNLNETLCTGGSITVNGTLYNAANPTGTETFPGGSYLGCDSVVNVSLAFYPAASFNLNETLCTGGSITVNGTLYNAANPTGTEVLAGASANGCDSTVFVSLAFGNAAVFNLAPTLCPGGSVTVNGTVYNQANPTGSETFPGGSYLGCDSVVNVSLAFYPAASFNLNETLCTGGSITVNGTLYNAANPTGTEVLAGASANGCDSTVFVSLSFSNAAIFNLNPTLCPGGSVTVNGTLYDQTNPAGSETFPGGSYLGCDSVVNVSLAFFPAAVFNLNEALCPGGGITVNGTLYNQANPNGTEVLAGASANGCDSTVFVSLIFSNASVFNLNEVLCPGGSVTVNGTVYNQTNPTGTETFPGGSYLGCDSVVNVSLAFYPAASFNLNETLCTGGSITVNGTLYNAANPTGTEVLAGASANGCDSTVFVSLAFDNVAVFNLDETLCPGGSVVVNGTTYNQANPTGSETFPGGSYLGCDSVVNVSLAFYPAASFNLDETLCTGGSVTVNGTVYNAANPTGTEVLAGASANGCDSTVFVSLAFYPVAEGSYQDTLQNGESVTINGTVYDIDNPSGMEVIVGGSYAGCDSTVFVSLLFVGGAPQFIVETAPPTCHSGDDGAISLTQIQGGTAPFRVAIGNTAPTPVDALPVVFGGLASGTYEITVVDSLGIATSEQIFVPDAPELTVELGSDMLVELGNDAALSPQASFQVATWLWSPTDFLDCSDCPDPVALLPTENITYTVVATDANGCSATDQVSVTVKRNMPVYVPNVFSPNGDGINDEVTVYAGKGVAQVKSFLIFDRWGDTVYEQYNFQPNDLTLGWDGYFRGELMDAAVFVWFAEVVFADGRTELFKGDVTLLR